jgi:hypothetical protein
MKFDTVYYSHFWYSRFAHVPFHSLDGNLLKNDVKTHCTYLRLLSLFFNHIYIPRTHLITKLFSFQSKIAAEVLATRDVRFLDDAGVLMLSQFPGLDPQSDAERIIARSSLTTEVNYATSKAYITMFPKAHAFVPSQKEAQANAISFPEYGQLLEVSSPAIARQFSDLVGRSTLRDIPFFHEIFIRRLKSEFHSSIFEKLWRDTNSIYLTTGGMGINNFIPYFNNSIESLDFRHVPSNIDRYLFNPCVLYYQFLSLFLSHHERCWRDSQSKMAYDKFFAAHRTQAASLVLL